MAEQNHTTVTEFILIGFSDHPKLGVILFVVFLSFYLITIFGNMGMVLLIRLDSHLHTPMYFFLSHLSLLDTCYTSVIIPQMLVTLVIGRTSISYNSCATQFFFFTICVATECFLLAVMAYDRYVAISSPLLYSSVMTLGTCWGLVAGVYSASLSGTIIRTVCTFTLSFCGPNEINFFFCDLPPLLKLSCSDTTTSQILIIFIGNFVIFANVLVILVSYLFIIRSILHIKSVGGRAKTFSTCASHLTAVMLFFGTLTFMYMRSNSGESLEENKVVSVLYTVIIPMLNPFIYSLRNKEVKNSFRKVINRLQAPQEMQFLGINYSS